MMLIDTSVLIDAFRSKNKAETLLMSLLGKYENRSVSVITEFEVYTGATPNQQQFWAETFHEFTLVPVDSATAHIAAN